MLRKSVVAVSLSCGVVALATSGCVVDSEDENQFGFSTGAVEGGESTTDGDGDGDPGETDDPSTSAGDGDATTDDSTTDDSTTGDPPDPTTGGDGDGDPTTGDPTTGDGDCDGESPYMGGWDIGCCQDDIVAGGWFPGNIGPGTVLPDWTFTDQNGDALRVYDFCHEAIYFEYVALW